MADVERRFDLAMENIYRLAKEEAKYTPHIYLQMLHEHGGLQTAKILINKPKESDGYTQLFLAGRLDLTVEAMVFDNPEWHELFTAEELDKVSTRLKKFKYPNAVKS